MRGTYRHSFIGIFIGVIWLSVSFDVRADFNVVLFVPLQSNATGQMTDARDLALKNLKFDQLPQRPVNIFTHSYDLRQPVVSIKVKLAELISQKDVKVAFAPLSRASLHMLQDDIAKYKILFFPIGVGYSQLNGEQYSTIIQFGPTESEVLSNLVNFVYARYSNRKIALYCDTPQISSCQNIQALLKEKFPNLSLKDKIIDVTRQQDEVLVLAPPGGNELFQSRPSSGNVVVAIRDQNSYLASNFWPLATTYSAKDLTYTSFQILFQTLNETKSSNPVDLAAHIRKTSNKFETTMGKISYQGGRIYCPNCEINCTTPKVVCKDQSDRCCDP